MIQLGRTAWNNVIIFAMLLMIFLFNGLHHKILSSDESSQEQSIIPENSTVLLYQYPTVKIERIGTGWRASKALDYDLSLLDVDWRQAQGKLLEGEFDNALTLEHVTIHLAGIESPITYQLIKMDEQYGLVDNQQRILLLSEQQRMLLFPFTQ